MCWHLLESTINKIEIIIQHSSLNKEPNYSLCIDGNGNVEYNGISNVKTIGKHVTKLSSNDLKRVIHEFDDVYFFSFKDSYHLSDSQQHQPQLLQTSVSLRLGDKFKNIKYVEGATRLPSELKDLVKTVEKITNVDKLSGRERYWLNASYRKL